MDLNKAVKRRILSHPNFPRVTPTPTTCNVCGMTMSTFWQKIGQIVELQKNHADDSEIKKILKTMWCKKGG